MPFKCDFLLGLFIMLFLCGCKDRCADQHPKELATPGRPVVSPCGHFVLEVDRLWDGRSPYFQVRIFERRHNGEAKLLYQSETKFYERFTNYFLWDDHSRVWIYSGDYGIFVVFPNAQGEWESHYRVDLDPDIFKPPSLLRKLRPEAFRGIDAWDSGGGHDARTRFDETRVVTALGDIPQIGESLKDWKTTGEVRYRHVRQDHQDEYYISGHSTEATLSSFAGLHTGFDIYKESWDELLVEEIAKALGVESGNRSELESRWVLRGLLSDGSQIDGAYSPLSRVFWIRVQLPRSRS